MCPLDWAVGCPNVWLNIILGVFVRVCLVEINIWISIFLKKFKESRLSSPVWVGLIQSVDCLNRTKGWVRENSLCQTVFELGYWSSAFGLGLSLEFTPLTLLVLRPLESNWSYTISSPGSPAFQLQVLELLSLQTHVNQILFFLFFFIFLFLYFIFGCVGSTLLHAGFP